MFSQCTFGEAFGTELGWFSLDCLVARGGSLGMCCWWFGFLGGLGCCVFVVFGFLGLVCVLIILFGSFEFWGLGVLSLGF